MAKLIIIRGCPGSGKSTLARAIMAADPSFKHHYEADMFFMKDGQYLFDIKKIHLAHRWCQNKVDEALAKDENVIVSNTFVKKRDMEPYLTMAQAGDHEVEIRVCKGNYKSIHNVPDDVIARMKASWEE